MSDSKHISEVVGFFSSFSLEDDEPLRLARVPGSHTWTDEQWAAHDARIAAQRERDEAEERERGLRAQRARFEEAGFPRRALDAAGAADESLAAIKRVAGWKPDAESVLVLAGTPGCGKTVAATWWALHWSRPSVFLRSTTFAASSRYDADRRNGWLRAEALVLDDLGTEYADTKGNYIVDLDELVDTFYGDRRPLLITTNLDDKAFKDRYGARIIDRIRECGSFAWIASASMRRKS